MNIRTILLFILIDFVTSEQYIAHISRVPFVEYDKDFVYVKSNFSDIEKATQQNPIDVIPSFKIKSLRAIKNMALQIKLSIPSKNKSLFDKTLSLCPGKSKSTNFMIVYVTAARELAGINLKCAFKANETIISKAVSLRNTLVSFLFKRQNSDEHATEAVFFEQKSPPHVLLRLIFYVTKIRID